MLSSFLISSQVVVSLDQPPGVTLQFCRTTAVTAPVKGYHRSGWYDETGIKMMCESCHFRLSVVTENFSVSRYLPGNAEIHCLDHEIPLDWWLSSTSDKGHFADP